MSETQVKPRRRWFQVRLATLIVAVTVASIGFGLLPWEISLCLVGAFPIVLTTAALLAQGIRPSRGQLLILAIAWLIFYPVSLGPAVLVAECLGSQPDGVIGTALQIVYYPLIWINERQQLIAIGEYVDYWQWIGIEYAELVPLGIVMTAFGGWGVFAALRRGFASPTSLD